MTFITRSIRENTKLGNQFKQRRHCEISSWDDKMGSDLSRMRFCSYYDDQIYFASKEIYSMYERCSKNLETTVSLNYLHINTFYYEISFRVYLMTGLKCSSNQEVHFYAIFTACDLLFMSGYKLKIIGDYALKDF